jgi:hypothetical protein
MDFLFGQVVDSKEVLEALDGHQAPDVPETVLATRRMAQEGK